MGKKSESLELILFKILVTEIGHQYCLSLNNLRKVDKSVSTRNRKRSTYLFQGTKDLLGLHFVTVNLLNGLFWGYEGYCHIIIYRFLV